MFCGIGKTMRSLQGYSCVTSLWVKFFHALLIDEAGQVLEGFGLHLALFAKQIMLFGDLAQLPAFTFLPDEHRTLMRGAMTTFEPVLLTDQFRAVAGLSTFCSCLSYGGKVVDGEPVKQAAGLQLLLVLWEAPSGDDVPKSPASRTAAIASIEETCVVADVREN